MDNSIVSLHFNWLNFKLILSILIKRANKSK